MQDRRVDDPFRILIVDDESINVQIAARLLQKEGLLVSYALNAAQALQRIEAVQFDLFLVDIMMPEIDGISLCRSIQQMPDQRDVPLLFLTALDKQGTIVEAFQAGAVDYIVKPFYGPELVQRVLAHLRIRDLQKRLESQMNETSLQMLRSVQAEDELRKSQIELSEANRVLANWAHRDPLTGLWNRRKAWELMLYEADRSDRNKWSTGLIMIDLDHFKIVNDTHGHSIGDEILKQVSALILDSVRGQDTVIRWGGEEFLVILPETVSKGALTVAEKLRAIAEDTVWRESSVLVTFSLGVSIRHAGQSWDSAIKEADDALYLAKETGRNRVEAAVSCL